MSTVPTHRFKHFFEDAHYLSSAGGKIRHIPRGSVLLCGLPASYGLEYGYLIVSPTQAFIDLIPFDAIGMIEIRHSVTLRKQDLVPVIVWDPFHRAQAHVANLPYVEYTRWAK